MMNILIFSGNDSSTDILVMIQFKWDGTGNNSLIKVCKYFYLFMNEYYIFGAVALYIRCLPRNLGILGSNPIWDKTMTMIPHMKPVLVGSRKRTRQ